MEYRRSNDTHSSEPPPIPERSPLRKHDSSDKLKDSSERLGEYFWGGMASVKEEELSLPTWSANPQSAEDDDLHLTNNLNCSTKKRKSAYSWGLFLFCVIGIGLYANSRSKLNAALTEIGSLMAASQRTDLQMKAAEKSVRMLQRELAALNMMDQKRQGVGTGAGTVPDPSIQRNNKAVEEMKTMQDKLRVSAQKAETLKDRVQASSKHDIIEKYGLGPYRVEIELVFPGNLDGPKKFVLEMAPVNSMPHSVHTFLEMVSTGLLDGCSFILNALHVLKAAPLPYDGSSASEKARAFTKLGLESVAFREYSHDYPHEQYTVGFAADGSPSFYINTEDNSEIHAGDPCFAKVISGFETIKRLEASPTRNGIWFEKRIGIRKAVIL